MEYAVTQHSPLCILRELLICGSGANSSHWVTSLMAGAGNGLEMQVFDSDRELSEGKFELRG